MLYFWMSRIGYHNSILCVDRYTPPNQGCTDSIGRLEKEYLVNSRTNFSFRRETENLDDHQRQVYLRNLMTNCDNEASRDYICFRVTIAVNPAEREMISIGLGKGINRDDLFRPDGTAGPELLKISKEMVQLAEYHRRKAQPSR